MTRGKRLLLIAHHFPPYGGPQSLRWLRLVRHLAPDRVFDVLTVRHDRGVGAFDPEEESSIPPGTAVFRTYPGPLYRLSYRHIPPGSPGAGGARAVLRGRLKAIYRAVVEPLLVPDKMIEWIPWGYAAARRLVRERSYEAVLSSAFPNSDHVLGVLVRRLTGLPWIADYGDPWAFNEFAPCPRRRRIVDRRLEAALLKRMDGIIFTTRETADAYLAHYPFLDPEKLAVIPVGYDDEEFAAVDPERGDRFRVVYTGIFYKDRNPAAFFESLTRLDFDYEVVVAGDVQPEYAADVQRLGLAGRVRLLGHCPHAKALALQKGADVLLLFCWGQGQQIPAKLFEYFGAGRPILALRPDTRDLAAGLVVSHRRGIVVGDRPEEIAAAVREMHGLWKRGELAGRFDLRPLGLYAARARAAELDHFIEKAVAGAKPADRREGIT